jgi:hypothetical protein
MDVYLIIGEYATGKSSLMRCLTGSKQMEVKKLMMLTQNIINAYVFVRSAQEKGMQPQAVINEVMQHPQKPNAVVATLRKNAVNKCPDAISYITAFQNAGWNIQKTVLLDFQANNPAYINPRILSHVNQQPINVPAQVIRTHFAFV